MQVNVQSISMPNFKTLPFTTRKLEGRRQNFLTNLVFSLQSKSCYNRLYILSRVLCRIEIWTFFLQKNCTCSDTVQFHGLVFFLFLFLLIFRYLPKSYVVDSIVVAIYSVSSVSKCSVTRINIIFQYRSLQMQTISQFVRTVNQINKKQTNTNNRVTSFEEPFV